MGHKFRCLITYLFALLTFVACEDRADTTLDEENSKKKVVKGVYDLKQVVYNELTYGLYCSQLNADSAKFFYSENDLRAMGEEVNRQFEKRGFIVDHDTMKKRIRESVNLDMTQSVYYELNFSRIKLFLKDGLYKPEPQSKIWINYSETRHAERNGVFFDDNSGLLLPLRCVPEIIDVYERFPELIEAEKNMTWLKCKWSEEPDVAKYRDLILETIYHLNHYVYCKNDLESLRWIIKHTPDIAQSFFVEFRKENDPNLNKFMLDKVKTRDFAIEALFAERNRDGSVYIRKSLIDFIMNDQTQAKLNKNIIHQYVCGLYGKDIYTDRLDRFPEVLFEIFTLDQRREILAYMLNLVFKCYDMATRDMYLNEAIANDPGLIQYFIDNNCFDLEYLRRGVSVYRMRFLTCHWKKVNS